MAFTLLGLRLLKLYLAKVDFLYIFLDFLRDFHQNLLPLLDEFGRIDWFCFS